MNDNDPVPGTNDAINDTGEYVLRLFVTGASPNSARAVANLKEICEAHLPGKYKLEIVDVYQQPLIAENEQIIALPLLVKKSPSPERRMVGDMSDIEKVLRGLNLPGSQKK